MHRDSARALAFLAACAAPLLAAEPGTGAPSAAPSPFGPYAEPQFPFLTSSVDFRDWEKRGFPKENLAVRGVIVKLPHGVCACFDTDLLRWAAVWQAPEAQDFLTWTGIAPISYHVFNRKAEPGQASLPRPVGELWFATGRHPGFVLKNAAQVAEADFADPRPAPQDVRELGRGPVDARLGRWGGIRMSGEDRPTLEYSIGGAAVREELDAFAASGGCVVVERRITVTDARYDAALLLADFATRQPSEGAKLAVHEGKHRGVTFGAAAGCVIQEGRTVAPVLRQGRWLLAVSKPHPTLTANVRYFLRVPPGADPDKLFDPAVAATAAADAQRIYGEVRPPPPGEKIRPAAGAPLAVDPLPLPVPNPWKRNVRPSGMDFFPDGTAAVCTIDGDLWLVRGIDAALADITWSRVASGLHEPQSVRIVAGVPYVFTRDGIVRLHLDPARSRCIFYENFCNLVAQTAETREFAQDMVVRPGGGFYIAKGGQQTTNIGPTAGRIFEISADGRSAVEICNGLRMPYLGMHPRTGMLTATDQQGHHIPTTPVHIVRKGAYYGFPEAAPRPVPEQITEATIWIPHGVCQSAASQLWCVDTKMGPLDGSLLHLAYFKPAIFKVYLDESAGQGAVAPLGLKFDFAPLKAAVHPKDGLVYLCGFQIWGTEARDVGGMARIRPTGAALDIPQQIRACREGVYLKFSASLDAGSAENAAQFSVQRWNYKRTKDYGSAHYLLDGRPGQELMPVVAARLSSDRSGVFLRLADMRPVMQMRVDWNIRAADGRALSSFATLTVRQLPGFDFAVAGVSPEILQAKPPPMAAVQPGEAPNADLGRQLATALGCQGCHSIDGKMDGMKGPSWLGLAGAEVPLAKGGKVQADRAYLKESILTPTAKVRKGFDAADGGMPPYAGILSEGQIESILLFIESLKRPAGR